MCVILYSYSKHDTLAAEGVRWVENMKTVEEHSKEDRGEKKTNEDEKELTVESESPLLGPPTVVIMPTRRHQTGGNSWESLDNVLIEILVKMQP